MRSPLFYTCIVASAAALAVPLLVAAQEEGEQAVLAEAQVTHKPASPLEPVVYHLRFVSAFLASISMIIVSEFGDKTFFIAAIMAMRHNRVEVFSSAIAALALMTVLSAAMGQTLPAILDPKVTHYAATLLFFFFGGKLLYDASQMDGSGDLKEELEEVEGELNEADKHDDAGIEMLPNGMNVSKQIPLYRRLAISCTKFFRRFFSKVFIQCFTMTFLAEWGDRSQIATIALAAQKDAFGVTLGGIIGHSLCTGVAVLGGQLLATRISERTILISGGLLFLIFGMHSIYFGEEH